MDIKGTAAKTIPEFVKKKYPDSYQDWLESLPPQSRAIMNKPILATQWYDVSDAVVWPTRKIGDLFFDSHIKAAWELGRYSSETALKGVYKIFIRIASPLFVLSRIGNVLSAYYSNMQSKVLDKANNKAVMQFYGYTEAEKLNIYRVAGWIEKTIETCAKREIKVWVEHRDLNGKPSAVITAVWG